MHYVHQVSSHLPPLDAADASESAIESGEHHVTLCNKNAICHNKVKDTYSFFCSCLAIDSTLSLYQYLCKLDFIKVMTLMQECTLKTLDHTHVERHDASKICTLACVRIFSLIPFFHTLKSVNFFENRAWHDLHLTLGDLSADLQANLKFNQLKLHPNCVK